MSFFGLIDDIIVDKCHRVEEFKDDTKVQDSFFIFSVKSCIDDSESVGSDSFATRKDEGIDIFDEVVDLFVVDELLGLVYFIVYVCLQYPIKGDFE